MFFKIADKGSAVVCILLVLSLYSIDTKGKAESKVNLITVTPNTCVTLHKGRKCFALTNISWQTKTKGNYCINIKAKVNREKCWQDVSKGEFIYELTSKDSVEITLHARGDNLILAKTIIEVTWLYKGDSRKRRWRLF